MFTGIISALGKIEELTNNSGAIELKISAPAFFKESADGDSVAVNGICLTILKNSNDEASFFAQIETIEKTNLRHWKIGEIVNLEHPLRLSDRLGGHLVQGHVDSTVSISEMVNLPDGSCRIRFEVPQSLTKFLIEKGSVCLNGVSLTVASKNGNTIDVALIPATLEKTIFSNCMIGDLVNIEIDSIARYVEQLVNT